MRSAREVSGLFLVSASVLASCGGSSSPAQPAPLPSATPTPQPTPVPPPLSSIPPCSLPTSNLASCTKPQQQLAAFVNAAIDRTIVRRPDLFNLNDVNGGPRILDYQAYMIAVVAALGEVGACGKVDAEGEIMVKTANSFSEHWIIASRAGWNPPSGNWVQRKYVGACSPSAF
jgi:hypothetical protein